MNCLTRKWCEEFLEGKKKAKEKITDRDIVNILKITPERRLEFREAFKKKYDLHDMDEEQRELICDMAEASAFGTKEDTKKAFVNYRGFITKELHFEGQIS